VTDVCRLGGSARVIAVLVVVLALVMGTLTGANAAPDGSEEPVGGWPLTPRPEVVARFDPPDSPFGAGHRGVDLAGRPGQPVHSALAGRVTFVGTIAGRGVIVVNHGATRTTYEPVEAAIGVGHDVIAGQIIGRLQLPGSHCFPRSCLHWGWLRGEVYLDPLRLVGIRPVRLLPLWGSSALTGLGPRVSLVISPLQSFGRDMRIELRGVQGRVPQQLLHRPQVRTTLQ
jgi:murein DD-endopeptidase MepM/ murein hydrolase activator NlpD